MSFDHARDLSQAAAFDAADTLDHEGADTATEAPGAAFADLGLAPEIVRAIAHAGYPAPTEVQARSVPAALTGRDLLVSSQTGSGKTAAFTWPALQRILDARRDPAKKRVKGQPQGPRVLVLAPTRELAQQVSRACTVYGHGVQGLRVAHVVGGVPYHAQLKALRGPLDVLIATPGRLMDLMNSGAAILAQVELLILDEADRMLDMGFIDDITYIGEQLPPTRQTLMFSATFAGSVGRLAEQLTREPQRISIDSHTDTHASIEQRLHWADSLHHKHALLEQILTDKDMDQCVVFTSTQRDADELAHKLGEIGHAVAALHGAMPQGRRNRVLQALRQRQLRVLVATDVAARGIDVPTITHVVNFGLPMKAEDYVHRIGRTGRAGRNGLAITLGERRDIGMIRRIERFTTQPIAVAVVAGLEPKMTAPTLNGPERGGKPGFGRGRPGFGGPRGGFGGSGGFGGGRGGFGGERNAERGGFGADRRFGGGDRPAFGQERGERAGFGGGDRGFGGPRNERGGFGPAAHPHRDERRPFSGHAAGGHRDEGHAHPGHREGGRPQGGGFRDGGFRNDSRGQGPRGFAGKPAGPRRNPR